MSIGYLQNHSIKSASNIIYFFYFLVSQISFPSTQYVFYQVANLWIRTCSKRNIKYQKSYFPSWRDDNTIKGQEIR